MFGAVALVVVLVAAVSTAEADDGRRGPERWIADEVDLEAELPSVAPGADSLGRLIEHCKSKPVGVRPLVTMLPPDPAAAAQSQLPTIALFARVRDRTVISLTRVQQSRTDPGQDIVMQRTVVSDLFAGRSFSLTVYEDHALGVGGSRSDRDVGGQRRQTSTRLMNIGTRMTFRPTMDVAGWRFRFEVLGSYDLDVGASGYLAVTGVLQPPPLPLPVGAGR